MHTDYFQQDKITFVTIAVLLLSVRSTKGIRTNREIVPWGLDQYENNNANL